MKLALIYHQFVRSGGLENYLIEYGTRMKAAGHTLELVCAGIAPEVQAKLDSPVHRVPLVQGSSLVRMWQFARQSGRVAEDLRADVTIGFGRTYSHRLHRAGGGCHAIYSRLLPWWKRWSPKNRLELQLEKKLYTSGATRRFITNSHRVSAQLQGAYRATGEKFSTIHTAVDTELFKPAENRVAHREAICEKMKTDAAKPVLLFVSLSHRRKGLDALLQAMKTTDATLWIAGKPLGKWHLATIESLGIAPKVRSVTVTNSLIDLYQAADWFVHPTLYDACANTVLQSMACGLPGLISTQDGAVDHVHEGENGFMLFHPKDVEELAGRIQHAISLSPERRSEMGMVARETMLPLTWERHIAEWMRVIEDTSGAGLF
jgi:glycosyltransferase involved in cell wall biosynthesis